MRVRRVAVAWVLLVSCSSLALAAPLWMRRSESLLPVSGEECAARANRAFRAEGFTPTQQSPLVVWGNKGDRWTLVMCNAAPNGQTWANIVSACLEQEASIHYTDHERVGARMGEPSSDPYGGPPGATSLTAEVTPQGSAGVSWRGGTADAGSWVSVVPVGTPDGQHTGKWQYTQGTPAGTYDSGALAPGEYEARFYADGGYGKLIARVRFTVGGTTGTQSGRTLSVEVTAGRSARVSWRGANPETRSWVSVVPIGTGDGEHTGRWRYTDTPSGTYDSGALAAGQYEARFYADGGYSQLVDRVRFTVY